jgi:hypothetical protein
MLFRHVKFRNLFLRMILNESIVLLSQSKGIFPFNALKWLLGIFIPTDRLLVFHMLKSR